MSQKNITMNINYPCALIAIKELVASFSTSKGSQLKRSTIMKQEMEIMQFNT